MAHKQPTLTPASTTSAIRLPATGTTSHVSTVVPFGIYTGSVDFLSGAADQVAYTYKKLGGDVVDIELSSSNVYAAYEESVLEYSYIVNVHQAKNILGSVLGDTTGTFNHRGNLKDGPLSASLSTGSVVGGEFVHAKAGVGLKYPKVEFSYARRFAHGASAEVGVGGYKNEYSASFDTEEDVQDYDLQTMISSSALTSSYPHFNKVGNKRINITQVYYKTPQAMWRFYGYYGGLNTVGNLQNYGQWADDSQFQIIPVWQNKLQAKAFESAMWTRTSHHSYEIKNNKLRIFPHTTPVAPTKMWIKFTVEEDAWKEESDKMVGTDGINNMNTIPFGNLPYESINSIGKQWIRRFALALTKEVLGQVRGKFSTIPIPGETVTLNHSELLSQAKEEKTSLREELQKTLDELTYAKLSEQNGAIADSVRKTQQAVPLSVYVG